MPPRIGDKGATLAPRSRPEPRIGAQRNKVNVALPFSKITAEDPAKMKVGDWFSLAGLVISVIGFGVAIRLLIRIAKTSEADQGSYRASWEEAY